MPIYEADDQRAWEAKMARVQRIWDIMYTVWEDRDAGHGWDAYYTLEKNHGSVPDPSDITPELVHEGLLPIYDDQSWKDWINNKLIEYRAQQEATSHEPRQ